MVSRTTINNVALRPSVWLMTNAIMLLLAATLHTIEVNSQSMVTTDVPSSYNDKYNEVVPSTFIETINKELPKEGKFFDDFNVCK